MIFLESTREFPEIITNTGAKISKSLLFNTALVLLRFRQNGPIQDHSGDPKCVIRGRFPWQMEDAKANERETGMHRGPQKYYVNSLHGNNTCNRTCNLEEQIIL